MVAPTIAAPSGVVAGLVARMMAECILSATWWVGVISISVKPASAKPRRYSSKVSAPAIQPT